MFIDIKLKNFKNYIVQARYSKYPANLLPEKKIV